MGATGAFAFPADDCICNEAQSEQTTTHRTGRKTHMAGILLYTQPTKQQRAAYALPKGKKTVINVLFLEGVFDLLHHPDCFVLRIFLI
jgi:hypothetical protein